MIADVVYDVNPWIILNSCVRAVTAWDLITSMIKAWVFGSVIAIVSPLLNPLQCAKGVDNYPAMSCRHCRGCLVPLKLPITV